MVMFLKKWISLLLFIILSKSYAIHFTIDSYIHEIADIAYNLSYEKIDGKSKIIYCAGSKVFPYEIIKSNDSLKPNEFPAPGNLYFLGVYTFSDVNSFLVFKIELKNRKGMKTKVFTVKFHRSLISFKLRINENSDIVLDSVTQQENLV